MEKFPDDPELKQIDEEIRFFMENYLYVTQIVPETATLPALPTATVVLLAATATPNPSPSPVPVEPSPMPTMGDEGPVAAQTVYQRLPRAGQTQIQAHPAVCGSSLHHNRLDHLIYELE